MADGSTGETPPTPSGETPAPQHEDTAGLKSALEKEREARKAAERAAREHGTKASEYDKLVEARKSTEEKLTDRAQKAEGRASDLEAEVLRLRVAIEKQLPADLADRLRGDDETSLAEDADKLLGLMAPSDGRPRMPSPDPRQGGTPADTALNGDPLLRTLKDKLGIG